MPVALASGRYDIIPRLVALCGTLLISLASQFAAAQNPATQEAPNPSQKTITVGGTVVDSSGKAVPGAMVKVDALVVPPNTSGTFTSRIYGPATTDDAGHWSIDTVPDGATHVSIGAAHPLRGGNTSATIELRGMNENDMTLAKAGTLVLQLRPVQMIRGKVTDFNDEPVSGALVNIGNFRNVADRGNLPLVYTNNLGEFEFSGVPGSNYVFTFFAANCAPKLVRYTNDENAQPLDIHLKPARTITGRVVGPDNGLPRRSFLYISTWQGTSVLSGKVEFKNASGAFEIPDMPSDPVNVWAGAFGEGWLRAIKAGDENILRFGEPPKLDGTVVDADTKQPIVSYKVFEGFVTGEDKHIEWQRPMSGNYSSFEAKPESEARATKDAGKNTFKVKIVDGSRPYVVRVESEGYEPMNSKIFEASEKQAQFTFEMKKLQK